MWFSVPKLLVQKLWLCQILAFIQGMWNFSTCRQKMPRCPSPVRILGTKSLISLLGRQHFKYMSQLIAGGAKCFQYESTGRELLEAWAQFLSNVACVFFLCWLCFVSFFCKATSDYIITSATSLLPDDSTYSFSEKTKMVKSTFSSSHHQLYQPTSTYPHILCLSSCTWYTVLAPI